MEPTKPWSRPLLSTAYVAPKMNLSDIIQAQIIGFDSRNIHITGMLLNPSQFYDLMTYYACQAPFTMANSNSMTFMGVNVISDPNVPINNIGFYNASGMVSYINIDSQITNIIPVREITPPSNLPLESKAYRIISQFEDLD